MSQGASDGKHDQKFYWKVKAVRADVEPLMKEVLKEAQYIRIRKKMHEIFDHLSKSQ